MNKLLLFFLLINLSVYSQTQEDAWVYFADKPNANYFYSNPLEMLNQRSLDRRSSQGISLDIKDVPLDQNYVNQIANVSGITIIAKSKWLNCLHVQGTQSKIQQLLSLSFVDHVEFANQALNGTKFNKRTPLPKRETNKLNVSVEDFVYGTAANQIQMIGGDYLHQQGFSGQGMQIAVIDAGFTNVNTMGSFARIRNNNQILGTYNFIEKQENVYWRHYHGTMVLSTIAGFVQNQFVGTAPDASFYLFISEDGNQEHPYEESLWVEAAEKADSLGVDVLTTSLGYTTFDNSNYNHSYEDMDGQSTFISRGSEIAFSRGMLVVNSAGNEGGSSWHYIGAPADAVSVLSVGAVNSNEDMAYFSSFGPTYDGRVKPDVCAQGSSSAVIDTSNNITTSSGTSFSGPIFAGVATCFWQAFPNKTNAEIAQIIKESCHLYNNPQNDYGYGIPDFEQAYNTVLLNEEFLFSNAVIYPNPVSNQEDLILSFIKPVDEAQLSIVDLNGKNIKNINLNTTTNRLNIKHLHSGIYILKIKTNTNISSYKLVVK